MASCNSYDVDDYNTNGTENFPYNLSLNRATPGSNWKNSGESDLLVDRLRRAMGVMQHHDAVTGTEKQAVAYDYARLLSDGVNEGEKVMVNAMSKLLPNFRELIISQGLSFCTYLNISICDALEAEIPYVNGTGFGGVYVMIYNPTGWHVKNSWFRLPIYVPNLRPELVNIKLYDLRTGTQIPMPFQLVPISTRVRSIPERRVFKSTSNMELVFSASGTGLALPPAGFSSYFLKITNEPTVRPRFPIYHEPTCSQLSYISKTMTYRLHVADHGPRPVTIMALHKDGKSKLNVTMQMLYYYGETSGMQASGAYVFLPKMKNISQTFPDPMVKSFSGECVEEVHLHYNVWATLVVRLYRNGEIETDWIVGPIPDHHLQFSREVIIRYQVTGDGIDPSVSGEFFTDSAGRRLIRRVRNERPDWNINYRYQETQPVAGNYYPVINRIMLKGSQRDVRHPLNYWEQNNPAMGFAVYTDRAQGGSSLRDGEVELMVHRRLIKDDGYGVAEALIENGIDRRGLIARGTHRLRLDELHVIEREDQQLASKLVRPPKVIVAPAIRPPNKQDTLQWSALNKELPPHIHLLSMIAWPLTRATADPTEPDQLLLRLEHLGSAGTSGDEDLVLTSLFRGIRITDAREVTLTADQDRLVALHKRLRWPTEPVSWRPYSANAFRTRATHDIIVRLKPSTISTFLLRYEID
ncbi:unnamed protein product [Echinostoma caproni]|uniref:Alpha-mannosidase n=1 Tax=Echinostoma caproni TaxID=27848 RepID=A0A183AMQ3_9TREM|nr:unnamed protein product [Echinostoma caproni]